MSTRSASDPPASILRSGGKRLRFDDDNSATPCDSTNASSNAGSKSPTAVAKERIQATVEKLPHELQTPAVKLATNIFLAYTKWFNKKKRFDVAANDSEYLPKELQFQVKLQCCKEVTEGQDFKALSSNLDAAVLEARKALKPFVMSAKELDLAHLRLQVFRATAEALPSLAELLLADVDAEAYGKHILVTDFLTGFGDDVMSYLGITAEEFAVIYQEVNQLTSLPITTAFATAPLTTHQGANNVTPATATDATAAAGESNMLDMDTDLDLQIQIDEFHRDNSPLSQEAQQAFTLQQPSQDEADEAQAAAAAAAAATTPQQHPQQQLRFNPIINGHETCLKSLRVFVSALANAKEAYHSTINKNDRLARIGKVLGTQQKGQQTDQVAETLESEETITPQTLGSLVDQKAEAKARPIRQKMSAYETSNKKLLKQVEVLTKEVKELKTSKGSRGAGGGAASTTQSNHSTNPSSTTTGRGRGRGDAAKGNASQRKSSGHGSRNARSKSPSSNRGRGRGRGRSSGRSRQSS